MFGQVFLYLGDKAVSTPGRDRCRPCRELFGMCIGTADSLQPFFSGQVGKRSGGIALYFFPANAQTITMAGKEVDVVVAVALGINHFTGSLLAGGSEQAGHFAGNDRFHLR